MASSFHDVFREMYSQVLVRRVESVSPGEKMSERKFWINPETGKYEGLEHSYTKAWIGRDKFGQNEYIDSFHTSGFTEFASYLTAVPVQVSADYGTETSYYSFDGVASTVSENPQAERRATRNKSITFALRDYCEPDFNSNNHHGWFSSDLYAHGGHSNLPRVGDIIMGIVSNNDGKPKFIRWFLPSPQFYKIWRTVVLGDETSLSSEWRKELNTEAHWAWRFEGESPCYKKMTLEERLYWMKQGTHRFERFSHCWSTQWVDFYEMILADRPVGDLEKLFHQMKKSFPNEQYWRWMNDRTYSGGKDSAEDNDYWDDSC